jgi:hypothetical protein
MSRIAMVLEDCGVYHVLNYHEKQPVPFVLRIPLLFFIQTLIQIFLVDYTLFYENV